MVTPRELHILLTISERVMVSSAPKMSETYSEALQSITVEPRFVDVELKAAKRVLDLLGSTALIVVVAPLLILIATLIKLSEGGPVLFAQMRIGKEGRRFKCLKFKTMVVDAEQALCTHLAECPDARREWSETQKLRNDPRVTKFGRFLRKSSFDELPQLLNVVVGDMSLVGPRPILDEEVPRYGEKISAYLSVRPGITGLWQVSGRSDCTYEERVALDTRYVCEWRLQTDLLILLRTVPALLHREGSY